LRTNQVINRQATIAKAPLIVSAKRTACIATVMVLLLSSCSVNNKDTGSSAESSVANNASATERHVETYDIYEQGAASIYPSEFNLAMADNPIDICMYADLSNTSASKQAREVFADYSKIWQDEMEYSIVNLKTYLTEEEAFRFDAVQVDWLNLVTTSHGFDRLLISSRDIHLGTQYTDSVLIYMIDQYRERVLHIKYITFLVENRTPNSFHQDEQLWNRFHNFEGLE